MVKTDPFIAFSTAQTLFKLITDVDLSPLASKYRRKEDEEKKKRIKSISHID